METQSQSGPHETTRDRRFAAAKTELQEISRTVRRFATFANSGGTIATLSFIGAILGASGLENFKLPSEVFWILVTFLAGLLMMLLELIARRTAYEYDHDRGGGGSVLGFSLRMAPAIICLLLSLLSALGGIVASLILLYGYTI